MPAIANRFHFMSSPPEVMFHVADNAHYRLEAEIAAAIRHRSLAEDFAAVGQPRLRLRRYLTGCRKGEILNLKWSQVDIERRIVKLAATDTKNGMPRTIPLSESIADTLDALPRVDEHVFTRAGKWVKDVREAWSSACTRAAIPNVRFHDLRRTAVRNLVRANVPERVAMDISGHKTRSIFDRYNIIVETELHEAMAKVENRFTQFERTAVAKAATNNGVDRFLVPKEAPENTKSPEDPNVPTSEKEAETITVTSTSDQK